MQDKEGLQIGLTDRQVVSLQSTQFSRVQSTSWVESSKEPVERDLDRALSTYIKYREKQDSAERCPSEA